MNFKVTGVPYSQTHFFSRLVLDYLDERETLQPFYNRFPKKELLEAAISDKQQHHQNRELLVEALSDQYPHLRKDKAVSDNIERLKQPHTFTITTAH